MQLRRISFFLTLALVAIFWTSRFVQAQATPSLEPDFDKSVKPFLQKNCVTCHNADNPTAGVRVDNLDASLDDRHVRFWEGIKHRVENGTMPPKGLPKPSVEDRKIVTEWIGRGLEVARLRPAPKNGLVRRLTKEQYRNTLRELLKIDDDLLEALPPDAISKDGFVNNKETLQMSPLLIEAYLEVAAEALGRAIVNPNEKPKIQNFRVDLGRGVNPDPVKEKLILGAGSELLDNADVMVTQLKAVKPFAFEPFYMRTKYRFIEGYQGNDTVRGWRDFDSIYHAVFADMRGSGGYPKGKAYGTVPEGLLLRPAIPNEEQFEADGTYGPKANFKISLRELPDYGRFRVTVTAAKYNDGLLLNEGAAAGTGNLEARNLKTPQTVVIPKAGIYQVDAHVAPRVEPPTVTDASRLNEGLAGAWLMDGSVEGRLEGKARFVDSPFGKAVSLAADGDEVVVPRRDELKVGEGEFTVSAWIRPQGNRRGGVISFGGYDWTHGWYLEVGDNRGTLRLETAGPDSQTNGGVSSIPGSIRPNVWNHVTAVVKRGGAESVLYVNGYQVGKGKIGNANLDNPKPDLHLGKVKGGPFFHGDIDEVRLHKRALGEAEIQALLEKGRQFVKPPPERAFDLTLSLGSREFSATLKQPAFVAVRLEAGPLTVKSSLTGLRELERVVFTPLEAGHALATKFAAFEKRAPKLGVHLGFRRDCGSTFAPVGAPQVVAGTKLAKYTFEGTITNYPTPNVEKDNVNYLAGVKEIAVRSEFTDGRDMPRLVVRAVEFEGPFLEQWPPPSHRNIFIDSPLKADAKAYGRQVVKSFAARAYRRPLTADEESKLVALFDKSYAAGGKLQESVKDVLEVVLTSPQFLFLIETSNTPKPELLSQYELASKLSYFLWNGPPDRTTMRLASTGMLAKQVDAEVDRMVADPRFSRFVQEFTSQWLSLEKFQVLEPDRKRFPMLGKDARANLKQEPVFFMQHLLRNNLPVKNLISSDFMIGNEVTASYYDLGSKTESGFQFVAIPHGRRELGGVLTQAAIMAGLSDGRESNPVKRGAWLARRIIAEPPADPPPNVPALKEEEKGLTLRQRLEMHRNVPACLQCHMKIDPWGVALEEFDAGGRLKKEPTDATSKLPDNTEVKGIDDLRRYLAEDRIDQVAYSFLKHMATYATGRTLTYNEVNYLKQDSLKLKANGYRVKDMIRYIVSNKIFLEK
jgi:hypothetical protein